MATVNHKLANQSVLKSFFQYLIPTLVGMMLMSVNILIDGIFVGQGVGSIALASVNIAVPVFSVIISLALLIGIGGGALYSMSMGEGNLKQAQKIFSISMVLVTVITIVVSVISYLNVEKLAGIFGANKDTLPYAVDYMKILIMFAIFIAIETSLSIFVRNDGNPQLAMIGLIVTAIFNIGLNYWMIFILELGVKGAAYATIIATVIGMLILFIHFFKKGSGLKLVPFAWNWQEIKSIHVIGFPSFLSEAGMGIFIVSYNIAMAYYVGTTGVAAFSVINYLHTFTFLAFIGIGSSIQPMISYYYGARSYQMIQDTVKIAEIAALIIGVIFIGIGFSMADYLVAAFGIESSEITAFATRGIKLFFISYLFMGINFIYMTYFQSIGYVKPSTMITVFRGFILLILMLLVLPPFLGITGIWLAVPVSEGIVAAVLLVYARQGIMGSEITERGF